MDDFTLTKQSLEKFFNDIQKELVVNPSLVVSVKNADTGKWGMARLWRAWMKTSSDWLAGNGATMPLIIKVDGIFHGSRPFNADDAHEAFTRYWMGTDENGKRLSWAKSSEDDSRVATKGERFDALRKHEAWAMDRGIILLKPRGSEYSELEQKQNE